MSTNLNQCTKNFNNIFLKYLNMSRPVNIKKDIPISQIRKIKRSYQKYVNFYYKVSFIEEIYNGASIKEAIEKYGKSPQTGYKWIKAWNDNGFDGLLRKEGSGRTSKLSDEEFDILKENIIQKDLTEINEILDEIQSEFGVTYSERHLKRLILELKLDEINDCDE